MQSNIVNPENGDAQISSEMVFFFFIAECDVLRCRKHSFIHSIWQADLCVILGDLLSFSLWLCPYLFNELVFCQWSNRQWTHKTPKEAPTVWPVTTRIQTDNDTRPTCVTDSLVFGLRNPKQKKYVSNECVPGSNPIHIMPNRLAGHGCLRCPSRGVSSSSSYDDIVRNSWRGGYVIRLTVARLHRVSCPVKFLLTEGWLEPHLDHYDTCLFRLEIRSVPSPCQRGFIPRLQPAGKTTSFIRDSQSPRLVKCAASLHLLMHVSANEPHLLRLWSFPIESPLGLCSWLNRVVNFGSSCCLILLRLYLNKGRS